MTSVNLYLKKRQRPRRCRLEESLASLTFVGRQTTEIAHPGKTCLIEYRRLAVPEQLVYVASAWSRWTADPICFPSEIFWDVDSSWLSR